MNEESHVAGPQKVSRRVKKKKKKDEIGEESIVNSYNSLERFFIFFPKRSGKQLKSSKQKNEIIIFVVVEFLLAVM